MIIDAADITDDGQRVIDWAKVEADYRIGQKVLRQIAEEHGITHAAIQKRAKRYGWTRDLRGKIAAETARALALRDAASSEESAMVDASVSQSVAVVTESRASVQRAVRVVDSLWARVDPEGDLDQQSRIVDRLTGALARMVDLRYKVFGLAVGDAPPDPSARPNSPAEDDAWRAIKAKVESLR